MGRTNKLMCDMTNKIKDDVKSGVHCHFEEVYKELAVMAEVDEGRVKKNKIVGKYVVNDDIYEEAVEEEV